jgi:hypothetical protein
MISLRHECPTEWSRFRSAGGTLGPLELVNRFRALFAHRKISVATDRRFFAVTGDAIAPLKSGTQQVKFAPSGAVGVATPNADTIDLGGAIPDEVLVALPPWVES